MDERIAQLRGSGLATFFNSFSPSSKAAMIFAIPFTIVDAVHYYTAGTALAFSTPFVILFFLLCGVVSGKLAYTGEGENPDLVKAGVAAGIKLWLMSTVINTVISLVVGTSTLGITLLLGLPYLCLCAPVAAAGGAVISGFGGWLYGVIQQRTTVPPAE